MVLTATEIHFPHLTYLNSFELPLPVLFLHFFQLIDYLILNLD
jgi:hypothetical protein